MRIRQIQNHKDYAVSDTGLVFRITDNGLIPLKKDISNGYARVKLDGSKWYVSNLVSEYFMEKPESDNYKIFYIDGDKANCSVENLCWMSQSDIQRYSHYTPEYRKEVLGDWA